MLAISPAGSLELGCPCIISLRKQRASDSRLWKIIAAHGRQYIYIYIYIIPIFFVISGLWLRKIKLFHLLGRYFENGLLGRNQSLELQQA